MNKKLLVELGVIFAGVIPILQSNPPLPNPLVLPLVLSLSKDSSAISTSPGDVQEYYTHWGHEAERLFATPAGIIERLRTLSIVERCAPKAPAVMYDIGGGAGVYAFPLAQQGYSVHLIDYTPLHIAQALEHVRETGIQLAECVTGDARDIHAPDASADIVLLLGPLYHLRDPQDRAKALREAHRILKPGGVLFVSAITRFAAFCDFGANNQLGDQHVAPMVTEVIETGMGVATQEGPGFFTHCAYFHHPDAFEQEVVQAGFRDVRLLSIEGPSWLFSSLHETVKNPKALETLLYFLEKIEGDRSIVGAGSHVMAIGKKQ